MSRHWEYSRENIFKTSVLMKKKRNHTENLSEVLSIIPSAMVGEITGFLILLNKILKETGMVMKRKDGSGDS